MIYQDPLTCNKPEGKAVLIKNNENETEHMEYWDVKFLSDGFKCGRMINKEKH